MRSGRRTWASRAAAATLLGASACAQLLGEDWPVIGPPPAEDAGVTPRCAVGELRCEGVALSICRADQSGFRMVQVCSSPELCCAEPGPGCDQVGCRLPVCARGDFLCEGTTLRVCNEAQTGWDRVDECASAAHCNASLGRCTEAPCVAVPAGSEFQCNGPVLEACTDQGWQELRNCGTQALCDPEPPGECRVTGCDVADVAGASAFRCINPDLQRCNDQQTGFEHVETCYNPANCDPRHGVLHGEVPPAELAELGCSAPRCIAGTYRCERARLLRCNVNRTAYTEEEGICASPSHCNASAGRCESEPCSVGSYQCSGNDLLRCAAPAAPETPETEESAAPAPQPPTWQLQEQCLSSARCDAEAAACVPRACASGEHRCNEAILERCNVDGTGWIPLRACITSALCDAAAKRCDAPVCEVNQRRCGRDGKLQVCAPGRERWADERDCRAEAAPAPPSDSLQLAALCDLTGATCSPQPSCAEGSRRCNGEFLERCEGNTWRPQQRCRTAALCDPSGTGSCRDASCRPGEYQCVTSGLTPVVVEQSPNNPIPDLTLQVCNPAGTAFVNVQHCDSRYCDAVHGQCDLCNEYEPICEDETLWRCSGDGQEKELELPCPTGCAPGRAACLGMDAGAPANSSD